MCKFPPILENCYCDECDKQLFKGDTLFCYRCYSKLINELANYEIKLSKLKEKYNKLKNERNI